MKIEPNDLRNIGLLKYYRLVRKWACKTYKLTDAELELLIHFDCLGTFTRDDYIKGTYIYSWDKHRWQKLRSNGWIDIYSKRNKTTIKYNVYKVSTHCKYIISRIYRILLGEEDLPVSRRSVFNKNATYTDKVFNSAIDSMNKDLQR
tara:strand:- start:5833 stop:6273 length:441 start_codon:yes stop_codon:yes gene_type:complete